MRYGVIGCGRIHRNHAQAALAVEGVELVGVSDVDEERAATSGREWNVPFYTDYREMLAAGVDAVGICLPHHLHEEVCVAAAQAGVHVFCEKPLATSVEECDRMIQACDHHGVKLAVVFQHRFNDNAQALRRLLDSGRLGRPVLGTALFQYYKNPEDTSYFAGSGWRGTWEREGGGVLNTHAVHALDLLCWFLGEVKETQGLIATLTHSTEVEDTAGGVLRFESGALATIAASMSVGLKFESRITISGTKGVAVLTDSRRLDVEYLNGGRETHVYDEPLDDPSFQTNLAYGRGHLAQLADFADAIAHDRVPVSDGRSARHVLSVVKSFYASARN
ncbi:oxidoreductase [Sphaerisporangium rufum]|uniref:Oxidoreductase n=1 Tax=Sphaerisporangium rufum TaxID=1381558 RepID=A0A919V3L1_9ACTN|nr:Gfo/Idh/MocA family oxidoreductase [Sphaerisporangium rufum]GII81839.1 oxidoreductase [Sphaerisporangium rufum]